MEFEATSPQARANIFSAFVGNDLDGRRRGSLWRREFAFGLGGRLRRELSESAERSPPSRPLGAPRLARISGFGVSRESAAGSGFYMPRRGDCGEL